MPFPLSTTVAIVFIALLAAYFVNLASGRIPSAKNVALGIVAAAAIFISVDLWFGYFQTLETGRSRDCSRGGACSVTFRDASPIWFWVLAALKFVGISAISVASLWAARQAFRRHGSAA
jgi:hypothetical protein